MMQLDQSTRCNCPVIPREVAGQQDMYEMNCCPLSEGKQEITEVYVRRAQSRLSRTHNPGAWETCQRNVSTCAH